MATGGAVHAAEPMVRIALLGGFRLIVGGAPVRDSAWRLRKARSLVKLLALAPGQCVPREQVLEALWPESDGEAAANSLRVALHAARRALAPHGSITSQGGLLALAAAGGLWIDTVAFEAAAVSARRERVPLGYAAALDLYPGELLPEDRFEDWSVAQRDYLRGLSLALLGDLAASYAADRDWSATISALQRILVAEPAHEDAHVTLVRTYALAGQRPRALQQWDQFVATLRRELDADPDPAAMELHDAIVAGTFPPTDRPGPADRAIRPRHNLPIPATALIGRDADLAALKVTLARQRLVTLTGSGGCGKTRLALTAAADVLPTFPGGVWFVDLAPLAVPDQVPAAVASVLGAREMSRRPLRETLVDCLARGTTLIVLDNCEHLRDACTDLAAYLLAACPDLRFLATSRVALGAPGEAVWRVPSLRVPSLATQGPLAELAAVPSMRLFVERARGHRPDFVLTAENGRAVAEITRRLDGIPLALELAATRVGILTPKQLAERLGDSLGLLIGGRAAAPRQRTLRATLEWSYRLLDLPQRILLARMSVFAGGGDLEAIEAVCADEPSVSTGTFLPHATILDALAALTDHSLVQADEAGSAMRYRLLETVRQFAAEQLAAGGDADAVRERHAAYYEALAEVAAPHLTGTVSTARLARLERDHDNLRAALRRLLDHREVARALALVGWVSRLWYHGGHPAEGRRWCAAALALPGAAAPTVAGPRALALHGAAQLAYLQGEYVVATDLGEQALALQQWRENVPELAAICITLGAAAYSRKRHDEAQAHYAASLTHWQVLGDRSGIAHATNGLGLVAAERGDYAGAATLYEEALAIDRARGDSRRVALILNNLAIVVEYLGDFARAEALFRESLDRYREVDNTQGQAMAHDNLGVTLRGRGEYGAAVPHHEAALALWRALGNRQRIALALTNLGATVHHLGESERAQALHEEGLGHARALEDAWISALTLENLGRLAWARGDRERAAHHATESLALYRSIDNGGGIIATLCDLARVARAANEPARALDYCRESLERCGRSRDRSRLPGIIELLALLLADDGQERAATHLLGSAAALRDALGKPPGPGECVELAAALVTLRAALGDVDFAHAWATGRALTADAALAAALAHTTRVVA